MTIPRRTFLTSLLIPLIVGKAKTDYCCELCDFDPFEAHGTKDEIIHWSDCAVNSEPAYPAGPCDCFHVGARIEHKRTGEQATIVATKDYGIAVENDRYGWNITFKGFKDWRRI